MEETVVTGDSGQEVDIGTAIDTIAKEQGLGKEPSAEPTPAPAEPAPADAKPNGQDASAEAPAPAPAAPPAPDTWRPAAKGHWDKLPPEVQAEVMKREADMVSGLQSYEKRAKAGDYLAQTVQPFHAKYQAEGINVYAMLPDLLRAHALLMWGEPEQKANLARALLKDAGLDPSTIGQPGEAQPQTPKEILEMKERVAQLDSSVRNVADGLHQQRAQEMERQILKFAADASHPYFYEVMDDVTLLMTSGVEKDLESAYATAVMRNPVTRAKEFERMTQEALRKSQEEARKKVTDADSVAAAKIRSSETTGGAAKSVGSIDDTLKEALAEIKSRG